MRIKSIRLAWFRGAADPVELEAASKSIVVYGANGAGKSSFVDAIEYVIKDGKVGHLAHEYSGRYQEKAIPNTHTPTEQQTKISITFANGTDLTVKIYPKGIPSLTRDNAINMSTWDYRRIVLRQDEVAEFIRSTKGDKYSALLPLLGLHELEIGADNLRQLAKAIEEHSKLKEKLGFLRQTLTKRKEVFSDGTDKAIEKRVSEVHAKYCTGVFEAQEYVAG
ncbi:MAG: AAA family ATPase [Beijerinckiaceae bacterium]